MEIQGRFNQNPDTYHEAEKYHAIINNKSARLVTLFYIVVCDSDVDFQFTHMIVNPTDAQFKDA